MARSTGPSWLLLLVLLHPVLAKNVTMREVTPDDTIKALAKQKKDAVDTFNNIFGGTADLMGELAAGQTPSLYDIAKDIVPGLIALTGDPLLSAVSSYVLSFLGALFKGESSLTEEEEIDSLIDAALLQEKLNDVNHWLGEAARNVMRWTNEFNETSQIDELRSGLQDNIADMAKKEYQIFSDCGSPNAFPGVHSGSQTCMEWATSGALHVAIDYVGLRLQTEASYAHAHAGDIKIVQEQASIMKNLAGHYQPIIQGMYNIFRTSRLMAIGKPVGSDYECHQEDWATNAKDNFNGFDFMEGCPNFRKDGSYKRCRQGGCTCEEAGLKCYNTYVNKIQAQLERLEKKIASLDHIIDMGGARRRRRRTSDVVTKRTQSNLQELRGFDTHVSSEQAENRSVSLSSGIDYCSSPDFMDWCDRSTGSTGLWVWPCGHEDKKQAYTMQCSSSQSIFVSIHPHSCVTWQCFGQSEHFDAKFDERGYGTGEVLLAWSCQQKMSSDTGRLCWKYLPPLKASRTSWPTSIVV